jgi:transcriptional regulator with XRE-family HTH domain
MREEHQDIGRRIAALREGQGWSQRSLAKVLGLDQSALSRIEAGHRRVTASELQRLARVLHVTVDDLLAGPRDDLQDAAPPEATSPAALSVPPHHAQRRRRREAATGTAVAADELPQLSPADAALGRAARTVRPMPPASSPAAEELTRLMERPVAARGSGAAELLRLTSVELPENVAAVVAGWFRLREVARGDLALPFSSGRSAQGKPAGWAPLLPPPVASPGGEVLYDRLARFWRNELHVEPDGPLPDLVTLLEDMLAVQVIVARVPMAPSVERAPLPGDETTSAETPFCASLLLDDVPFLFVNAARPVVLQRYALTHAFAHLVLRHGDIVDQRIEWARSNPREAAANDVAEELLAPVLAVARWYDRRHEQTPTLETLLDLGNAFGISAWAALYRSRAAERARTKTFSALRAELQAVEWQVLPRQAFLGGLRDTLSALTPGEVRDPGAFGRPAVLRVPAVMRRWGLQALSSGRLSLEEVAGCLHLDPAALAADLERLGLV